MCCGIVSAVIKGLEAVGANFKAGDYVVITGGVNNFYTIYSGYTGIIENEQRLFNYFLIRFTDLSYSLLSLKSPGTSKIISFHKSYLKLYEPNKTP